MSSKLFVMLYFPIPGFFLFSSSLTNWSIYVFFCTFKSTLDFSLVRRGAVIDLSILYAPTPGMYLYGLTPSSAKHGFLFFGGLNFPWLLLLAASNSLNIMVFFGSRYYGLSRWYYAMPNGRILWLFVKRVGMSMLNKIKSA